MFKSASEKQSFMQRVASHSTKGHANGRVDVLPPEAHSQEVAYQEIKRQFEAVGKQIPPIETELVQVRSALKRTLPMKEFHRLSDRLRTLEQSLQAFRTARGNLREAARAAGAKSYTSTFYHVAFNVLSKEAFREIDEQTAAMIGRPRHEIKKANNICRDRHAQRQDTRRQLGDIT